MELDRRRSRHWLETVEGEKRLVIVWEDPVNYMPYKVEITNQKTEQMIIEAVATNAGVNALLDQFTDLDDLLRKGFMRTLTSEGHSEHIPSHAAVKPYKIVVSNSAWDSSA